jgi:hypothetical protein
MLSLNHLVEEQTIESIASFLQQHCKNYLCVIGDFLFHYKTFDDFKTVFANAQIVHIEDPASSDEYPMWTFTVNGDECYVFTEQVANYLKHQPHSLDIPDKPLDLSELPQEQSIESIAAFLQSKCDEVLCVIRGFLYHYKTLEDFKTEFNNENVMFGEEPYPDEVYPQWIYSIDNYDCWVFREDVADYLHTLI